MLVRKALDGRNRTGRTSSARLRDQKAGLPPRSPRRMGCRPRCFNLDLVAMPTAATNDWMSAAHPGLAVTLPDA